MSNSSLIHKQIFKEKIKNNKKILLDSNDTNIINDNLDIINELNLIVDVYKHNNLNNSYYDIAIINNLNFYTKDDINNMLRNYKNLLKSNGKILIITSNINSDYNYCKQIYNIIYDFCNIYLQNVYNEDIYYSLLDNQIKIIDNYRIYSENNYIFNRDVFVITCIYYL